MIDKGKHNLLGVYINAVDYEAAVNRIIQAAHGRHSIAVSALAVHGVMMGALDSEHAARLNALDLVVPDGQPVRWALNLLHKTQLPDRVYGPTLTLKVCEQAAARGLALYLYGSRENVLQSLKKNLMHHFPDLQIVGMQPSKFRQITLEEKAQVVDEINCSGASVVLVGLGCPRQEVWVYEHKGIIHTPMLAVGAAFDFHAGTVPQAHPRLQRLGLEWAYRLSREPMRLWKRYLLLNPLYLWLVFQQALGVKQFAIHNDSSPSQDLLRYG